MQHKTVLVSLIGHQPLPNLLVLRYVKPDVVIFIYSSSSDPQLINRKNWLVQLTKCDGIEVLEPSSGVDPWDFNSVPNLLAYELLSIDFKSVSFIFDVTGGTKAMSVGLSRAAAKLRGEIVYLESERSDSYLRRYRFTEDGNLLASEPEKLPKLVTLKDFFYIQLGLEEAQLKPAPSDPNKKGIQFEINVRNTLAGLVDDMLYSIKPLDSEEIDIVLQKRNRFAIIECKAREDDERRAYGILQLNNLASERYLGTYTGKILAVVAHYSRDASPNFKMAKQHKVHLLELPNWEPNRQWTVTELQEFEKAVYQVFDS